MTSWYTLPDIEYYAGRYFIHDGVEYTPGQVLPREKANKFPNLESAIRSRYLIPIAPDRHVIPRHRWGEAQAYETVLRKHRERAHRLNLPAFEDTQSEPVQEPALDSGVAEVEESFDSTPVEPVQKTEAQYDPEEHNIREVLTHVDARPWETEDVLEKEKQGKARVRLIDALEERLTRPE